MPDKRFIARPSRLSRASNGNAGGTQVFGIFYDDGSPSESWIHLRSDQRPRPLFLIKSPEGITPVQKVAADLNAGVNFLTLPSLGHGTILVKDFHSSGLVSRQFSLACLGTGHGLRDLEIFDKFSDTPPLLNRAMEQGGRFSLSIVASCTEGSSGLYRPAFVFRTFPYRTNREYLEYVLSTAIRLRDYLNSSPGLKMLHIPFFFADHVASRLDCIKILESLC